MYRTLGGLCNSVISQVTTFEQKKPFDVYKNQAEAEMCVWVYFILMPSLTILMPASFLVLMHTQKARLKPSRSMLALWHIAIVFLRMMKREDAHQGFFHNKNMKLGGVRKVSGNGQEAETWWKYYDVNIISSFISRCKCV